LIKKIDIFHAENYSKEQELKFRHFGDLLNM
jgi:hypothetical protein